MAANTSKEPLKRITWRSLDSIILGLIALSFVAWIIAVRVEMSSVRPTAEVTTFETYLAKMPAPEFVHVFSRGEKEILVAYGSTASWTPASGPPAYVFDRQGSLQDWTYDIGDNPSFVSQWTTGTARLLTIAEAKNWIAADPAYGDK